VQVEHGGFRLPDEQALRLENFAGAEFFRILSNPYREIYWGTLRTFFERKFAAAPVPLGQPEAIDIAEGVLADAAQHGLEAEDVLRTESIPNLPPLDEPTNGGVQRETARYILRTLMYAGWVYFQTYGEYKDPVLEFTVRGHRLVAHMLRELRGDRLPLRSFADQLHELVGSNSSGMRSSAGRLRQLRDVVSHLNERIHELLGSIKEQSQDVVARAKDVRAIIRDLLVDFERQVGYDYVLLQRQDSPPRLWDAVMQSVHDLGTDPVWMLRESEWYREVGDYVDLEEAGRAVSDDLAWISRVMDNLRQASDLLDHRYAKYVSRARRRVEAHLSRGTSLADGLIALLEAARSERVFLVPVEMVKVTTLAPVGFTFTRAVKPSPQPQRLQRARDLTPEEARESRRGMESDVPLFEVLDWLRSASADGGSVHVDSLPLESDYDYLMHIYARKYSFEAKSRLRMQAEYCTREGHCASSGTCAVCTRAAGRYRVPRGTYTISASTLEAV
jgi:hypothetical protein